MPITYKGNKVTGLNLNPGAAKWRPGDLQFIEKATKNDGGSWFNVAHNTTNGHGQNPDGRKTVGHLNKRDGHGHTRHLTNPAEHRKNGGDWFGSGADSSLQRRQSSKSSARKHASAQIAKIPFALSSYIARAWYPVGAAVSLA
jgi:hypothetical protein